MLVVIQSQRLRACLQPPPLLCEAPVAWAAVHPCRQQRGAATLSSRDALVVVGRRPTEPAGCCAQVADRGLRFGALRPVCGGKACRADAVCNDSRLQNAPLLVAASAGPALGVAFMAYNLLYNTTVVRRLAAFTLGRALHCG